MKMLRASRECALGMLAVLAGIGAWPSIVGAGTTIVRVKIENLAPENGTYLTPFWVGFQNGEFDLFDPGAPASSSIERLAEDGDLSMLRDSFGISGDGAADGVLGNGPIAPGQMITRDFTLDATSPLSRYLSYATMVIPSNDTFLANGNPTAFEIFDATGNFLGADFMVMTAWDAGTEVNDELPMNTAFFGQMMPNTGVDENGVVTIAAGFNPVGSGGVLDSPMFANADYTAQGYKFVRVTVSAVPEPSSLVLASLGFAGFVIARRRRSTRARY